MIIKGFKLTYNVQVPKPIVCYLRKRMNSLALLIQRKLGKNYNVTLNYSGKSEAGYFLVSPSFNLVEEFNGYKDICISLRNHHSKKGNYDIGLLLCDFNSWDDLRKFVITNCVPYIKSFDRDGLKKEVNHYVLNQYIIANKEA